MEGEGRWYCEAPETQGVWQGQARYAPIQDFENLRQPSRFCFHYFTFFFFFSPGIF